MKRVILNALFASMLILQPVHAGNKMDGVKKVARICWHMGQVFGGVLLSAAAIEYLRHPEETDIFWSILMIGGAAVPCIVTTASAGIRGLDRELEIKKRAKRLADRIRKRKKQNLTS